MIFGESDWECKPSSDARECSRMGLKKPKSGVCRFSMCPDQLASVAQPLPGFAPPVSSGKEINLSLRGDLCGFAEMVWGPDHPHSRSSEDARPSPQGL